MAAMTQNTIVAQKTVRRVEGGFVQPTRDIVYGSYSRTFSFRAVSGDVEPLLRAGSVLKHIRATYSLCSPPQPNPGLPGFGHLKNCRKRANPQPAGEGLGVGVVRFFADGATVISPYHPPPHPSPTTGEGAHLVSCPC